jgi:hypothetical protein
LESGELGWIHLDQSFPDDKSEEVDFSAVEETFFRFEEEIVMTEFSENFIGEVFQLFLGVGVNEDIVHIHDHPSLLDVFFENGIHHGLEGGRGVGKTEKHNRGLKQAFVGDKCSFPLISIFDPDVIVSPLYVYLGEIFCAFEFVEKIRDSGKRVGVADGGFVELLIVLAGTERTVLLFDKEEGGGLWGEGMADISFLEVILDEGVEFALLVWRQAVNLPSLWFETGLEIDAMVPGSGSREAGGGFFVKDREVLVILAGDAYFQGSEVLLDVLLS